MQNTLSLSVPIHYSFSLNLKLFLRVFLIGAIILLVIYIFQANFLISESYRLQNYQQKLNELSYENTLLKIDLAKINSLENIQGKIAELGFEKAEKIYYLRILDSQIVTRNNDKLED